MTKQECIDEVMDWFDFGTVTKMMEAVDFGWSKNCEDFGVPKVREHARKVIEHAWESPHKNSGTGGFFARWTDDENGLALELRFVGADWLAGP